MRLLYRYWCDPNIEPTTQSPETENSLTVVVPSDISDFCLKREKVIFFKYDYTQYSELVVFINLTYIWWTYMYMTSESLSCSNSLPFHPKKNNFWPFSQDGNASRLLGQKRFHKTKFQLQFFVTKKETMKEERFGRLIHFYCFFVVAYSSETRRNALIVRAKTDISGGYIIARVSFLYVLW